jgi:hypothetical protein
MACEGSLSCPGELLAGLDCIGLGLTIPGILHAEKSPSKIDAANALDSFKVNSLGAQCIVGY